MVWDKNRIKKLKANSSEAQAKIVGLFANAIIRPDPNQDVYAWGQFLDDVHDNKQYGIYGTSAGIEVLSSAGYEIDHECIKNSIKLLSQAYDNPSSLFRNKGDFFNNYKLALWAEMINHESMDIDEKVPLFDELITRKLAGLGWGNYYITNKQHDLIPNVLSTAFVLFALRRYTHFKASKACKEAIEWLCKRLIDNGSIKIYELAISMLTLLEYQDLSSKITIISQATIIVFNRLVEASKNRKKSDFDQTASYHYPMASTSGNSNKYLFFLPDCLVALALIKRGCAPEAYSYVLEVIKYFVLEINKKGGYIPKATDRMSSIDHLWISRLLKEFRKIDEKSMVSPRILNIINNSRWFGMFLASIFLGLGIWGIVAQLKMGGASSGSIFLLVISVISGVVGLGVFANYIHSLFPKIKSAQ